MYEIRLNIGDQTGKPKWWSMTPIYSGSGPRERQGHHASDRRGEEGGFSYS